LTRPQPSDTFTGVMHVVGSRQLRPRLPAYLQRAERGDEFIILVNGRAAAVLRPFRMDDEGALISSQLLRDELHKAIASVRTSPLIVIRYTRVVAVIEAPPASLQYKRTEEAS
jgi:antitoxin (DNA-binding transcriptional repressor) of toxin-antitoxin stability system